MSWPKTSNGRSSRALWRLLTKSGARSACTSSLNDSGSFGMWGNPMSLSFPKIAQFAFLVGRSPGPQPTPSSACRVLREADSVGEERVQGDPRRPGGLPHYDGRILSLGESGCPHDDAF